jgi:hypothetical protein
MIGLLILIVSLCIVWVVLNYLLQHVMQIEEGSRRMIMGLVGVLFVLLVLSRLMWPAIWPVI